MANTAYHELMNGFGAFEWLARAGFLAKGVVYMVIGVLALQVAARAGGRVTGTRGALITVVGQPFGRTLLLVAAVGLCGYAAWRILQGLLDPDQLGHDWRALGTRVGFVAGGMAHAALGWQAFRPYRGLSAPSGGSAEREAATEALRWPLGDWLVVPAGLGLIGFAVEQVYPAITNRLERNFDVERTRREAGAWAAGLRRFGMAARAVAFALLGWAIVAAGCPGIRPRSARRRRRSAPSPSNGERWAGGFLASQRQVSSPTVSTKSSMHGTCTSGASAECLGVRMGLSASWGHRTVLGHALCPQLNALKGKADAIIKVTAVQGDPDAIHYSR